MDRLQTSKSGSPSSKFGVLLILADALLLVGAKWAIGFTGAFRERTHRAWQFSFPATELFCNQRLRAMAAILARRFRVSGGRQSC